MVRIKNSFQVISAKQNPTGAKQQETPCPQRRSVPLPLNRGRKLESAR